VECRTQFWSAAWVSAAFHYLERSEMRSDQWKAALTHAALQGLADLRVRSRAPRYHLTEPRSVLAEQALLPLDLGGQAIAKRRGRLVAELGPRLADIGHRVSLVAGAGRLPTYGRRFAG
jgi:hypothetical protein